MLQGIDCYLKAPWDCVEREHGMWNFPRDLTVSQIVNIKEFFFRKISFKLDWFKANTETDVSFFNTLIFQKITNNLRLFGVMPGALIVKINMFI